MHRAVGRRGGVRRGSGISHVTANTDANAHAAATATTAAATTATAAASATTSATSAADSDDVVIAPVHPSAAKKTLPVLPCARSTRTILSRAAPSRTSADRPRSLKHLLPQTSAPSRGTTWDRRIDFASQASPPRSHRCAIADRWLARLLRKGDRCVQSVVVLLPLNGNTVLRGDRPRNVTVLSSSTFSVGKEENTLEYSKWITVPLDVSLCEKQSWRSNLGEVAPESAEISLRVVFQSFSFDVAQR